jgi:hypothetical protein
MLFDLYARLGLSRRQVSARLNAAGRTHYGRPFTHPLVGDILKNPAYIGCTRFGRKRGADFYSFNDKGLIVEKKKTKKGGDPWDGTPPAAMLKEDTHEGLIDKQTWDRAQERLAAEKERPGYSPRNGNHWLTPVLFCGHCGRGMTGRADKGPGGEKITVYLCLSYVKGQRDGHPTSCGYQRITHEVAERLLLAKLEELGRPLSAEAGTAAWANLQERLARLGVEDEAAQEQWLKWLDEGVSALAEFLLGRNPELGAYPTFLKLRRLISSFLLGVVEGDDDRQPRPCLPVTLGDLRQAVKEAEAEATAAARARVAELTAEQDRLIAQLGEDLPERVKTGIRNRLKEQDRELTEWEERTVPLSDRVARLEAAEDKRQTEREKLLAEWPTLEGREKGEMLRRLFKRVELFWSRTWHPAPARPTRPRKTRRPGRWSYDLDLSKTRWHLAEQALTADDACSPGTCNRSGR